MEMMVGDAGFFLVAVSGRSRNSVWGALMWFWSALGLAGGVGSSLSGVGKDNAYTGTGSIEDLKSCDSIPPNLFDDLERTMKLWT